MDFLNLNKSQPVKKIVFITQGKIWLIGRNSGASSLWLPIEGYLKRGFNVIVINSSNDVINFNYKNLTIFSFYSPIIQRLKKIRKLGYFIRILRWFRFQFNVLSYYNKIKGCSLIITNGPEPVPIAFLLSRALKVPLVKKFRGVLNTSYPRRNLIWLLKYWNEILALKLPSSLLIVTNNGSEGDKILDYLGFPSQKVRFWINGYSPNEFRIEKRKSNKINILSVCRYESSKGIYEITKAFSILIKFHHFPNVNLTVVGDGSEFKKLNCFINKLGIKNRVCLAGAIKREHLYKYYNNADIFVSINKIDILSNSVLEAMRYNLPIIALRTVATSTLLKNNDNCILLENDNNLIFNLSEALYELINHKNTREKLGSRAYDTVISNQWTWEERVAAEVKEIELLINENQN